LFHKDKEDENVVLYRENFEKYIGSLQDQNELYKAFTEITILRIKLDKNDSIFKNIRDAFERYGECEIKKLITCQFNDVIKVCKSYKKADYELIESTMKKILPNNCNESWTIGIFDWIKSKLDNSTGHKK
jgi:hypothetical protein